MSENPFEDARYERTQVYLEDRYEDPKHLFTVLADKIEPLVASAEEFSLLDVGSATGEFGYYLKKRFPDIEITNLEYDKKLIEVGKAKASKLRFVWGDANNMDMFADQQFDLVTMIGVLSIFDDFSLSQRVYTGGGREGNCFCRGSIQ